MDWLDFTLGLLAWGLIVAGFVYLHKLIKEGQ